MNRRDKQEKFSIRKTNRGAVSTCIAVLSFLALANANQGVQAEEVIFTDSDAELVYKNTESEMVGEDSPLAEEEPAPLEEVVEDIAELETEEVTVEPELASEPAAEIFVETPTEEQAEEETGVVEKDEAEVEETGTPVAVSQPVAERAPVRVATTTYRVRYVDEETNQVVYQRNHTVSEEVVTKEDDHQFTVNLPLELDTATALSGYTLAETQELTIRENAIEAIITERGNRQLLVNVRKDDVAASDGEEGERFTSLRAETGNSASTTTSDANSLQKVVFNYYVNDYYDAYIDESTGDIKDRATGEVIYLKVGENIRPDQAQRFVYNSPYTIDDETGYILDSATLQPLPRITNLGNNNYKDTVSYGEYNLVSDGEVIVSLAGELFLIPRQSAKLIKTDEVYGKAGEVISEVSRNPETGEVTEGGYTTADTIAELRKQGYELYYDDFSTTNVYDNDGNVTQRYDVLLREEIVPLHIGLTPGTPVYDEPNSPVWPDTVDQVKTFEFVTRTIHYLYAKDNSTAVSGPVESLSLTRDAFVNLVTGEIIEGSWEAADNDWTFDEVTSPRVFGYLGSEPTVYSSTRPKIDARTLSEDEVYIADYDEYVYYSAGNNFAFVKYIDEVTGETIIGKYRHSDLDKTVGQAWEEEMVQPYTGEDADKYLIEIDPADLAGSSREDLTADWTGELIRGDAEAPIIYDTSRTLSSLYQRGYTLVKDELTEAQEQRKLAGYTSGDEAGGEQDKYAFFSPSTGDYQLYKVTLNHRIETVTPDDNPIPGSPVDPDDPNSPNWPGGIKVKDTLVRTINYVFEDGTLASNPRTQEVTFTRTARVDLVDSSIEYTDWSEAQELPAVQSPLLQGYITETVRIPSQTVTAEKGDIIETVVYKQLGSYLINKPDGETVTAIYPNDDNKENPSKVGTPSTTVPYVRGYNPITEDGTQLTSVDSNDLTKGYEVPPIPVNPTQSIEINYIEKEPTITHFYRQTDTGVERVELSELDGETSEKVLETYINSRSTEVIAYSTDRQDDATLAAGVEEIRQAGQNGQLVTGTTYTVVDGQLVKTSVNERTEPVTEIIAVGTKVAEEEPADLITGSVIIRYVDLDGKQIREDYIDTDKAIVGERDAETGQIIEKEVFYDTTEGVSETEPKAGEKPQFIVTEDGRYFALLPSLFQPSIDGAVVEDAVLQKEETKGDGDETVRYTGATKGKVTQGQTIITYVYRERSVILEIQYVTEDGQKLYGESDAYQKIQGVKYSAYLDSYNDINTDKVIYTADDKVYRLATAGDYPVGQVGESGNLTEFAPTYGRATGEVKLVYVYSEVQPNGKIRYLSTNGEEVLPDEAKIFDDKLGINSLTKTSYKSESYTKPTDDKLTSTKADGRQFQFKERDKENSVDNTVIYLYEEITPATEPTVEQPITEEDKPTVIVDEPTSETPEEPILETPSTEVAGEEPEETSDYRSSLTDERDRLLKDLDQLQSKIDLAESLLKLRQPIDITLSSSFAMSEEELRKIIERLQAVNTELETLDKDLVETDTDLASRQAELAELKKNNPQTQLLDDIGRIKAEIATKQARIQEIDSLITSKQAELDSLGDETILDQQIADKEDELVKLKTEQASLQADITQKTKERDAFRRGKEQEIAKLQAELEKVGPKEEVIDAVKISRDFKAYSDEVWKEQSKNPNYQYEQVRFTGEKPKTITIYLTDEQAKEYEKNGDFTYTVDEKEVEKYYYQYIEEIRKANGIILPTTSLKEATDFARERAKEMATLIHDVAHATNLLSDDKLVEYKNLGVITHDDIKNSDPEKEYRKLGYENVGALRLGSIKSDQELAYQIAWRFFAEYYTEQTEKDMAAGEHGGYGHRNNILFGDAIYAKYYEAYYRISNGDGLGVHQSSQADKYEESLGRRWYYSQNGYGQQDAIGNEYLKNLLKDQPKVWYARDKANNHYVTLDKNRDGQITDGEQTPTVFMRALTFKYVLKGDKTKVNPDYLNIEMQLNLAQRELKDGLKTFEQDLEALVNSKAAKDASVEAIETELEGLKAIRADIPAQRQKLQADIKELEQERARLVDEIAELEHELATKEAELKADTTTQRQQELEADLKNLTAKRQEISQTIEAKKLEQEQLKAQETRLAEELASLEQEIEVEKQITEDFEQGLESVILQRKEILANIFQAEDLIDDIDNFAERNPLGEAVTFVYPDLEPEVPSQQPSDEEVDEPSSEEQVTEPEVSEPTSIGEEDSDVKDNESPVSGSTEHPAPSEDKVDEPSSEEQVTEPEVSEPTSIGEEDSDVKDNESPVSGSTEHPAPSENKDDEPSSEEQTTEPEVSEPNLTEDDHPVVEEDKITEPEPTESPAPSEDKVDEPGSEEQTAESDVSDSTVPDDDRPVVEEDETPEEIITAIPDVAPEADELPEYVFNPDDFKDVLKPEVEEVAPTSPSIESDTPAVEQPSQPELEQVDVLPTVPSQEPAKPAPSPSEKPEVVPTDGQKVTGSVIIRYVDYNDEELRAPETILADVEVGQAYDVTSNRQERLTHPNGRQFRIDKVEGQEQGQIVAGETTITYYYTWATGRVVVRYHIVDQEDNIITAIAGLPTINILLDAEPGTPYDVRSYRKESIVEGGKTYYLVPELTKVPEQGVVIEGELIEIGYYYRERLMSETPDVPETVPSQVNGGGFAAGAFAEQVVDAVGFSSISSQATSSAVDQSATTETTLPNAGEATSLVALLGASMLTTVGVGIKRRRR